MMRKKKTNKPVNVHLTDPDDRAIDHSCDSCNKCYLFVSGPRTGSCPYGGPFTGYVKL